MSRKWPPVDMSACFVFACACLFVTTSAASLLSTTLAPLPAGEERLMEELHKVQETMLSAFQASVRRQCPKVHSETAPDVLALRAELDALKADLLATKTQETKAGSTFIRWGRKECTNNSQLVYSGVAGGSWYSHAGAAANLLCLTMKPQYDDVVKPKYIGYLYGSEYNSVPGHHDQDVPCSVCRAPQPTTIMVPATLTCPSGWTAQYTGHLAAGYYGSTAASEYLCLDGEEKDVFSGNRDQNGNLISYVVTKCGSLPCPPYLDDRVATCVVCSK